MAANTHSDAVTALEAATAEMKAAANAWLDAVNGPGVRLASAVDRYNTAAMAAADIAREMCRADDFLELNAPHEVDFEAPEEWPVDVDAAARQVAVFADLDAAQEEARDGRRDYHEDMKHRADMSNPDRYL